MSPRPSQRTIDAILANQDCAALNAQAERTARLVERLVRLVLALTIGVPLGWWLAEWATCPGVC